MKMLDKIKQHALDCAPKESCGLIVIVKGRKRYVPCRNIAPTGHFAIAPEDYVAAEELGVLHAVVHSHVNQSAKPSEADLINCEKSGLKWMIVSVPSMEVHEFEPSGYELPLYGRKFDHGTVDCYSFIRDYYKQELDIELLDFDRADNWWHGGENLYLDNFGKAGFVEVSDLQPHDVILMKIGSSVPNHGAIYLGNGKIGHHQQNRLSSVDMYGGYFQKATAKILRYQ